MNALDESVGALAIETLQSLLKLKFGEEVRAVGNCALFIGPGSVSLTDERGGVIAEGLEEVIGYLEG